MRQKMEGMLTAISPRPPHDKYSIARLGSLEFHVIAVS